MGIYYITYYIITLYIYRVAFYEPTHRFIKVLNQFTVFYAKYLKDTVNAEVGKMQEGTISQNISQIIH
jgi:hypothetical protein